jgi:uncharacterized membrane protein YhdT
MILLLANSYIKEFFTTKKKENFNNDEYEYEYENDYENENENKYLIWIILYYIICFIAAYLSWDANTKLGFPTDVKLACALNAYSFGIFYIIYYLYFTYKKK